MSHIIVLSASLVTLDRNLKHKDLVCMQMFKDSYEHKSPEGVYPGNGIKLYGFRGVGI